MKLTKTELKNLIKECINESLKEKPSKTYLIKYKGKVIGQLSCKSYKEAKEFAKELFFDPEKMDAKLFNVYSLSEDSTL